MIITRRHQCVLCGAHGVLYSLPVCSPCWQELPRPLARPLLRGWQARLLRPEKYLESLAAVLQWRRDQLGGKQCPSNDHNDAARTPR